MTTAALNPYQIFVNLKQAGWHRDFDTSPGNNLCVPVSNAPALGSHPGGVLFFGAWTKPDGTTLFQRSNMDRSVTTIMLDPMGNVIHSFKDASLADSSDHLIRLKIV
jgi:hypothetical protein